MDVERVQHLQREARLVRFLVNNVPEDLDKATFLNNMLSVSIGLRDELQQSRVCEDTVLHVLATVELIQHMIAEDIVAREKQTKKKPRRRKRCKRDSITMYTDKRTASTEG